MSFGQSSTFGGFGQTNNQSTGGFGGFGGSNNNNNTTSGKFNFLLKMVDVRSPRPTLYLRLVDPYDSLSEIVF